MFQRWPITATVAIRPRRWPNNLFFQPSFVTNSVSERFNSRRGSVDSMHIKAPSFFLPVPSLSSPSCTHPTLRSSSRARASTRPPRPSGFHDQIPPPVRYMIGFPYHIGSSRETSNTPHATTAGCSSPSVLQTTRWLVSGESQSSAPTLTF